MVGAMTDACKRRFFDEEDLDYSTALDDFEVVQAINEFNAGGTSVVGGAPMAAGLGPYGSGAMDEIPMMASDPQVAIMGMIPPGFPTQAAQLVPTTKYAVQGDNAVPPADDASWYPEVNLRRHGSRTQAADFAGYLMRYKVRILKVTPSTGFAREMA